MESHRVGSLACHSKARDDQDHEQRAVQLRGIGHASRPLSQRLDFAMVCWLMRSCAGRLGLAGFLLFTADVCRAQVEPWPPPFPMVSTQVDVVGDVGGSCSMALRPNGDAVIAYFDASLGALKLAERIQNVWHTQVIAPVEGGFHWCALALDPVGTIHVVYAPQTGVRHFARVGGFWVQDTITVQSGQASWDGALAIDSDGGLHVSFFLYPTGAYYAHSVGGGWSVEGVYTVPYSGGQFPSIAVYPDGTPAICLRGAGLRVYRRIAGLWVRDESVPSTSDVYSSSMAIGKDGMLRIAYGHFDFQGNTVGVHYAFEDAVGWHVEPVWASNGSVHSVSLRLNDRDEPLVAFVDGNRSILRLAFGGPGSWGIQPVDSTLGVSVTTAWCSMALDLQGFPKVAYYTGDNTSMDLRFVEGPAGVAVPPSRTISGFVLRSARPNPTRSLGLVSIDCESPTTENAYLVLYDLSGRVLARGNSTQLGLGRTTLSLTVPAIAPGVVLAALHRHDGTVLAARVVAILR